MDGVNNKPDAVYANYVAVSSSIYETRMEFFLESPECDDRFKEVADIRMSPQLAKKLRDILDQSIELYETAVETPIPSEKE